jgi:translocation and assembly module TamB
MEIKGNGTLNGDLDIKAHGTIPLEIISLLTDVFPNAAGEVRLSLDIKGNLSQPDLRADAEIINCGMTVPGLLQRMHDLNGSIHVTPKAIVLDSIQGMLDTGGFELFGAIDLKAYRPSRVELKLKAHDLPLMIPDTLETRLSAELDIKGTPEKSLVSGYIQMIEGKYYKDIRLNLTESLGKKSREEVLVAPEIPWPFLKNMALDITTRYREPFVIDNNMALLAIKPDLRIYGSVNHPLISGRAQVESGTVYFQKKEFNVKRGVFDFINPYKIEPTIDVLSEIIVRQWTVFLNISGTPDNLKFNFSSNPSEREEDILSLLITGKTTRELIAGEGGLSRSSGQILADVLAETVQKQIKDATGLDVVELEYKEGGEAEASDEVKVTVGKELSQRITVKYGVQTKNAKVIQQVITEYKFLEKLLMNAFQDAEGHYGGGLQFRVEFR